jgi:tetratricopeptide (TPR) repeat protein
MLAAGVPSRLVAAEGGDGDRAQLARLEQRSKAFYELLEHGDRERAGAAWPALAKDLADFSAGIQTRLDRMRDEVMERDGDLEELYRSPRWRDPEVMSLVATYHLAWVRYQGAQLVGDRARKQALLKQAIEGFSQFLLVNEVPEIYGDCLYGRGLAFLDLGETAKAIEDLTAASGEATVASKAKAALEEARRRGTGKQGPAENEPENLLTRLGDLLPRAAGGDTAAERDATTLARGLAARGGVWPAQVASVIADKLPRSSYGLYLLAQLAVDRGRCADVAPLPEASAAATDAGRNRYRPEILFLDAGCRLNAGKAREAADEFGKLVTEFPESARAREAAYYRFRALDVARTSDATQARAYEEALATYLARYPTAEGAPEAHYLLGELLRSRNDCARAEAEYAHVSSGAFASRARLGSLECRAGALTAKATAEERRRVLAGLRTFVRETPPRGNDQALVARAALLGAAVAAGTTPPDHAAVVELLDGFETRYPDAKELQFRALELRLVARIGRGELDRAGSDLDAFIGHGADAERRRTLTRLGRELATQAESGPPERRGQALALARHVYTALANETGEASDRLMLADLELRAGDTAAARRHYEEVLAHDPGSAEALRGAARAAAAAGDPAGALGYWRKVVEASTEGGTAWYEARLAQVTLLRDDGRRAEACQLLHGSRGRATSAGADQLDARLRGMEPEVCR